MSTPNVGGYDRTPYEIALQTVLTHLADGPPAIYADQAAPAYDGLHVVFTVVSAQTRGTDETRTHATEDEEEAPTATTVQHTLISGIVQVTAVGDGARNLADKIYHSVESAPEVEYASLQGLSVTRASAPARVDSLQGQGYVPTVVLELGFLWASKRTYNPGFIATITVTEV